MSSNRSVRGTPDITPGLAKARQYIATAFVQCLSETRCSQEAAARVLGVTRRTVGAWARCESPIAVERLLAAPRLAKSFRQALCTFDHGPGSAPYVAKKRGAK